MASVKIRQGDSYPILINVKQEGVPLTPSMVDEVEVSIGSALRKTYTSGGVGYDPSLSRWYIFPTQQETIDLEAGDYEVMVRVKYKTNSSLPYVQSDPADRIVVLESPSKEVL